MKDTFSKRFVYWAKNMRARAFVAALERYAKGDVLDVGGRDFFRTVRTNPRIHFLSWTNLEKDAVSLPRSSGTRYQEVIGDGCAMPFADVRFDTVINSLVLEHVFEPMAMLKEIHRVLRPGGYALFLIPWTAAVHSVPEHYYNFTRFWIEKAMAAAHLEIIELKPVGGVWSTAASHFVFFFLKAFRASGYSIQEYRRNFFFYALFPLMALYALVGMIACMLFSIGDLSEEPNYHLVAARKK